MLKWHTSAREPNELARGLNEPRRARLFSRFVNEPSRAELAQRPTLILSSPKILPHLVRRIELKEPGESDKEGSYEQEKKQEKIIKNNEIR